MKKLILILLFMLAFTLPVKAESLYSEQFGASGAGEIKNFLTDDATEILEDMEIDPSSPEWVNGLDAENVFSKIISFFKKGAKTPLKAGFTMLAFLLVTAAAGTFEGLRLHEDTLSYVFALASAAILLSPIVSFGNKRDNYPYDRFYSRFRRNTYRLGKGSYRLGNELYAPVGDLGSFEYRFLRRASSYELLLRGRSCRLGGSHRRTKPPR